MITREDLAEVDSNMLLADGFDDCILGEDCLVAYSIPSILKSLVKNSEMSQGERTPVFVDTFEDWTKEL